MPPTTLHRVLGYELIRTELFTYLFYVRSVRFAKGKTRRVLEKLVPIERKHVELWKRFFGVREERLGFWLTVRLWVFLVLCFVFRNAAIHLILESLEACGIRQYLAVWEEYKGTDVGNVVVDILRDEFEHEDILISEAVKTKINPERICSLFLGFNDGLVEMVGAVSGFFAAFADVMAVLIAAFTVAVAGAISMAASIFVARSSEKEVEDVHRAKRRFLGESDSDDDHDERPLGAAFTVGVSYLIGSFVPIAPVFFGSQNIVFSAVISAVMIIGVSFALAFLSGMKVKKRIGMNLVIIAAALGITYSIGSIVKGWWGIMM